MDERLEVLAQRLDKCRKLGNQMVLANILESAKILIEAKEIAGTEFRHWLKNFGGIDRSTMFRHFRVASFVAANVALTQQLAKLSIAKVYALTSLDFEVARGYITGKITLSKPLDQLNDLQFAREFRQRHPVVKKPRKRNHVYQEVYSAMVRLRKKLAQGGRHAGSLTPAQQRRIAEAFEAILNEAAGWKVVA